MGERLVLVDGGDAPLGEAGKEECHAGAGMLHRAFTALLFDPRGRLVLTRRSAAKPLWPGCWDGTFASHPRPGESYEAAAARRMPEELGAACPMEYAFKFEYHVRYGGAGSENEVCGTLLGEADPASLRPLPSEVSEAAAAGPGELAARVRADPSAYCPWMLMALLLMPREAPSPRHAAAVARWTDGGVRAAMLDAVRACAPDARWRLAG